MDNQKETPNVAAVWQTPIEDKRKFINQINIDLLPLANSIHKLQVWNGFYDNPNRQLSEMLLLIIGEVSESFEALRKDTRCTLDGKGLESLKSKDEFETYVKDTFEDEIADTFIRLLDLIGYLNIDIDSHIKHKLLYNNERDINITKNFNYAI